jgi:spore germination protein GerM
MQLQKQYGQTRLVLLNACLGALPAGDDPFSSVGAALLRGGVPAVIAMQFELAEDAAAELARVFYAELIAGSPADLALTEARLHLYGRYPTRLDWAIPVLFLRADDGVLFEVTADQRPTTNDQRRPDIDIKTGKPVELVLPSLSPGDPRLLRAHAAALTERWPEALALYEELAVAFTLPPSGAAELERARRETWLMRARAEAQEAETRGDWDAAVTLLEQIAQRLPDDADAAARLRQARDEQELAAWARSAADLAQAAEWDAVTVLLRKIEQRRPGYTHPTIDLAALGRRVQAGLAYRRALAQAEQGDWAGVVATLAAAPDEAADADLRALLDHARAKEQAAEEAARRQEQAERERLAALERERREAAERERQPVAARPQQETITCPACGKPNKPTGRFCATCGASLEPNQTAGRRQIVGSAQPGQADQIPVPIKAGRASPALDLIKRKPWVGLAIVGALVLIAVVVVAIQGRTVRYTFTSTAVPDVTSAPAAQAPTSALSSGGISSDTPAPAPSAKTQMTEVPEVSATKDAAPTSAVPTSLPEPTAVPLVFPRFPAPEAPLGKRRLTLYFTDQTGGLYLPEHRIVTFESQEEEQVARKAIQELLSPSHSVGHVLLPEARLLNLTIKDGVAMVNFDRRPTGQGDNRGFNAIVLTLTEFPGIQRVQFQINGENIDVDGTTQMARPLVNLLNPQNLPNDADKTGALTLYFRSNNNEQIPLIRMAPKPQQTSETAEAIIRALLEGPGSYAYALYRDIPAGTTLRSFRLENGIVTLDLTQPFASAGDGVNGDFFKYLYRDYAIDPIVMSLTALPDVSGVRILVEGRSLDRYWGVAPQSYNWNYGGVLQRQRRMDYINAQIGK